MSAEASSSTHPSNPQLGPNLWFTYPTPTPEDLEEELPPYFEHENVPLGGLLERVTRKGYGDMKELLEVTFVSSSITVWLLCR
jgi:mediator of RNA polymerase II transcription subunit 14